MDEDYHKCDVEESSLRQVRVRRASTVYDESSFYVDEGMKAVSFSSKPKKPKKVESFSSHASGHGTRHVSQIVKVLKTQFAPKALNSIEKEESDLEDRLIEHSKRTKRHSKLCKPTAVDAEPIGIQTIFDALNYAVKECSSLLLDWSSPEAKRIGSICKVYWDGDRTWFYARILNYDRVRDRHFVRLSVSLKR